MSVRSKKAVVKIISITSSLISPEINKHGVNRHFVTP